MKKIYLIAAFILFLIINVSAQQTDAVKNVLNRTETSIYKAQKHLNASPGSPYKAELTLAVKYQVLAVTAYKGNDMKSAACYSLKSREYSNEIFTQMKINNTYFLLNDEEKALATEYNYSAGDETYKTKITAEPIDEPVLLDAQKLGAAYKITIN